MASTTHPAASCCVLYIKHMVCPRGIRVVRQELAQLGLSVVDVGLGWATVAEARQDVNWPRVREGLLRARFALLEDPRNVLTEKIRPLVNQRLCTKSRSLKHSIFNTLVRHLLVGYPQISQSFSRVTGCTLKHYVVSQHLEYVRELLATTDLGMNPIARRLGCSSLAHLSGQFRLAMGCSSSQYRQRLAMAEEAS